MAVHCDKHFTVLKMEPAWAGGFYPGAYFEDAEIRFCPFCGCSLESPTPIPNAPVEEAASPAPKSDKRSKRGQAE